MLRSRLPSLFDISQVTGVASTFLYGWTIVAYLWQLPSWMLSLNLGEILALFAYVMLDALSETILVLACLLLLAVILPPRILRDHFVVRGAWIVIGLLGSLLIFFLLYIKNSAALTSYLFPWSFATLIIAALLAFLSSKLAFMRAFANWLSDRLQILLFLFAPLTVVSLITVLIRNLF